MSAPPQIQRTQPSPGWVRDRKCSTTAKGRTTDISNLRNLYQGDPRIPFAAALRDAGFQIEDVESDGGLHRSRMEGDRPGQRNGWYVLHADAIAAGAFGDWKIGESHTWRAQGGSLSPTERERLRDGIAAARRQRDDGREEDQRLAQEYAQRLWCEAA
jgi:putative DNA primase/helicase